MLQLSSYNAKYCNIFGFLKYIFYICNVKLYIQSLNKDHENK